jgi:formiminoglutamase
MADDSLWPRASGWLARPDAGGRLDLAVLGLPASARSLSPTSAHLTPAAVRAALARFSPYAASVGVDLAEVRAADLGDVPDVDGRDGRERAVEAVRAAGARAGLVVALGGDNSLTVPVATGLAATGLVTLDAHHDLRDGQSNGSPVRELVAAGMPGRRVVQVGLADFANSADYARRAADLGVHVVPREALRGRPMADVMGEALEVAAGGEATARVHVDLDVDVCDRSAAPACPASLPGGLSADDLRQAARAAGRDARVVGVDLVEVDAAADAADGRTVRLVALCVLETATGLALRPRTPGGANPVS